MRASRVYLYERARARARACVCVCARARMCVCVCARACVCVEILVFVFRITVSTGFSSFFFHYLLSFFLSFLFAVFSCCLLSCFPSHLKFPIIFFFFLNLPSTENSPTPPPTPTLSAANTATERARQTALTRGKLGSVNQSVNQTRPASSIKCWSRHLRLAGVIALAASGLMRRLEASFVTYSDAQTQFYRRRRHHTRK